MSENTIKKLALTCFVCGLIIWVIYGFIWEIQFSSTTPSISVSNGYIKEHTPGNYIIGSLMIGVFSSLIGTIITIILSVAYIIIKFPKTKLSDHEFSNKSFYGFITPSIIINIIIIISISDFI